MTEEWIIDGYNLLHELQSSKNQFNGKLDRLVFFALLADFASAMKIQALLVLDGAGDEAELAVHRTSCFNILYSQKINADTWIERCLFEKRMTTRLVVVTSDRAISRLARGGGARVIRSSEFWVMMKEARTESCQKLLKDQVQTHGFNRPFEDRLREKGFL